MNTEYYIQHDILKQEQFNQTTEGNLQSKNTRTQTTKLITRSRLVEVRNEIEGEKSFLEMKIKLQRTGNTENTVKDIEDRNKKS